MDLSTLLPISISISRRKYLLWVRVPPPPPPPREFRVDRTTDGRLRFNHQMELHHDTCHTIPSKESEFINYYYYNPNYKSPLAFYYILKTAISHYHHWACSTQYIVSPGPMLISKSKNLNLGHERPIQYLSIIPIYNTYL